MAIPPIRSSDTYTFNLSIYKDNKMIGDKLEVIIASFGYPVGLVVQILGVHKDGYMVSGNGIEKLVKFESVTKL